TDAESHTSQRQTESLTQHQPYNVSLLGSQRPPNAQFPGSLHYRIGDNSVDSQQGEQQRDSRKQSQQDHSQAALPQLRIENSFHGSDFRDGLIAVDRQRLIANRIGEAHRIRGGAHHQ